MFTILVFVLGLFIGWNLPMPDAAKSMQAKVLSWFKSTDTGNTK